MENCREGRTVWKSALDRYCSLRVQSMPSPVRMAEGGKVTKRQRTCTDGIGNARLHRGFTRPMIRSHRQVALLGVFASPSTESCD